MTLCHCGRHTEPFLPIRAFLVDHSEQAFLQEVDATMESSKHIPQEEAIRAISKYESLSRLYPQQPLKCAIDCVQSCVDDYNAMRWAEC